MSNGHMAAQFPHLRGVCAKIITNMPQGAMGVEVRAVEGDDTGCFLPAMLQGVQPKGCQHIRLIASEYAEDAALLMEAVKLLGVFPPGAFAVCYRHVWPLSSKNEINIVSSGDDTVIGQFP